MASVEQNKKKEDLENYLKELGSVAVSYTHLYVYKRQVKKRFLHVVQMVKS